MQGVYILIQSVCLFFDEIWSGYKVQGKRWKSESFISY